jgi:hypothetical protein
MSSHGNWLDFHFAIAEFIVLLFLILGCSSSRPNVEQKSSTEDTGVLSDFDGDGYFSDEDCDDTSQNTHPGAQEICDGADNDCDGETDEGVLSQFFSDDDGDGFGNEEEVIEACSPETGFVSNGNDCNDEDESIFPGGTEICDDLDNDCDGVVDGDDAIDKQDWYQDLDDDGYGGIQNVVSACAPPTGYVGLGDDCDDANGNIFPGAEELCNARDDDCDLEVDEDTPAQTWYPDTDEDGYGDTTAAIISCDHPTGYILVLGDCDDADSSQYPNAEEYCNNEDDDCDGNVDEGALDPSIWYGDMDGDGFGNASNTTIACDAPPQHVSDFSDCDDGDNTQYPGALEYCKTEDDNCNGVIDEDTAADASVWYVDSDGDGYGDPNTAYSSCTQPIGYLLDASDCDDGSSEVHPMATEICDGVDNNCDGSTDGTDAWANLNQPYRIPFTITGGAYGVDQPPIVTEVDFRAVLDSFGDTSAFAESDIRVVRQDCGLGTPDIPSQYLDEWLGVFDKVDDSNPMGDEQGTVVFLFDEDGDIETKERLEAGDSVSFALYFGGALPTPSYTTSLSASADQISTGVSVVDFLSSAGGMISSITTGGSPSLMSQATSCCGNGPYTSSWTMDPQDGEGQLTMLETGPLFAAVEAYGEREDSQGAYEYRFVYWMFANRPEIYAKVHQIATSDLTISHPGSWVSGLRPWESTQENISVGATFSNDPNGLYADTQGSVWGITWGYVQPPLYAISSSAGDPYLVGGGNDWGSSSGTPETIPAGVSFFDHIVHVVMPHEDVWSDMQEEFWAIQEGVSVVQNTPQAQ